MTKTGRQFTGVSTVKESIKKKLLQQPGRYYNAFCFFCRQKINPALSVV
jgi:hypothetical protein